MSTKNRNRNPKRVKSSGGDNTIVKRGTKIAMKSIPKRRLGSVVEQRLVAQQKRQLPPGVKADEFVNITQPGQQKVVPIQAIPVPATFSAAILGALQSAITSGFEDFAELNNPAIPGAAYYAYIYITQILYAYIANGTPQITKVPVWLDTLGCALIPMEAPFIQGRVSYSYKVNQADPITLSSIVPALGPANFYLFVNHPNVTINDYSTQVAPATYTQTLGEMSWNLLMSYAANSIISPSWKMVDPLSTLWASRDVSAFAVSFQQQGQNVNGVGSTLTEIDFETPVTCPLFAAFSSYDDNANSRYFRHARPFAGDANYCGYTLARTSLKRELKSKIIPKFKQVDFFEYIDVFSLWLGKALQAWFHNTTQTQLDAGVPPVWPLSWQDTCIMLRQAIGMCWSPEVLAGQFMATESSAATVAFVPFTWGTNCRPSNTTSGLMLPIILIEAIRSLQGVQFDVDFSQNGKKRKGGVAIIYPVLGVFSADEPPEVYEYESSTGNFSPVYTVYASETVFNLADMTDSLGNVVNVNSAQLNINLAVWNNFMNNLKANTCALEALGSDKPPRSLHSIHLTNFCGPIAQDGVQAVHKGSHRINHFPVRTAKRMVPVLKDKDVGEKAKFDYRVVPDPYNFYGSTATTSQSEIIKVVWAAWQQMIVLPQVRVQQSPLDTLTPSSYLDYGIGANEPYSMLTAIGDGISSSNPIETLAIRHDRFASSMIRNVMSPMTSLEEFLIEEGKKGRGGSLGAMFGGLAGNLLEKWIPGAGQIGMNLGSLLPV